MKQSYYEIIKLDEELKDYKLLCKGKSKKYKYYSDWKTHISEILSKFVLCDELETYKNIENFKHYLINHKRVNKNINMYFVSVMIFFMSIFFNSYFNKMKYSFVVLLITALVVVGLIIIQSDSNDKEYCFYCDLIDIVEEMEKSFDENN